MIWFEGNIAEAVALSKAKNAIFVVYVMGEDEGSTEMLEMINGDIISSKLANENHFLSIKLDGGSEHYTNFARIFQFVPVPSLFFIGRNGTPLEVVCPGIEPTDLASRIDKILQEHLSSGGPQVLPSGSGMSVRQQAQSFLDKETMMQDRTAPTSTQADVKQIPPAPVPTEPSLSQSPTGPTPPKLPRTVEEEDESEEKETEKKALPKEQTGVDSEDYEMVCEGDVCVRKPKQKEPPASPASEVKPEVPSTSSAEKSEPTIDDKVEKAKEIIEKRRQEKLQQEKEEEKKKELDRRAVGQGVTELKQWQHEQELKQLQEDRKREKLEETRARARILEQIAQDRAERRAREAGASHPADVTTITPSPQVPASSSAAAPAPAPAPASPTVTHARVQFKMPDGSTVTAQFDADATIGDLRQYLIQNVRTLHSPISIWSTFPRHELANDRDTLQALGLLPAVALIVHQSAHEPIVAGGGLVGVVNSLYQFLAGLFLTMVLQPGRNAWYWLTGSIRRDPSSASSGVADENRARPSPRERTVPRGQGDVDGVRYRPEGNIHRLRGDRSSDDENNTWNGNSTQQM